MTTLWSTVPLAEVVENREISYGVVQPGREDNAGVPIIRVKDVRQGRIDIGAPLRIAPSVSMRHSRTILRGGELLISVVGTIGESAVVPLSLAGWNVARAIAVVRPKGVSAEWIRLALQTPEARAEMGGALNTTVQATLNLGDLKKLSIPMPSSAVRQAIVNVAGALDDKIAANLRSILATGQLGRALLDRAAASGLCLRIDQVASLITRGGTPRYTNGDGLLVVNQKCVRDNWVDVCQARRMERSGARPDRILKRDDVLVNSTGQGTLGRVARWTTAGYEVAIDSHVTLVRFDASIVDPACAGAAMLGVESQIEALAEGSTGQTELRRDLLGAVELRLPARQAQYGLGLRLRQLDDLVTVLRVESDRLAATRDQLLPLLMSGKVRVRDAERRVEDAL